MNRTTCILIVAAMCADAASANTISVCVDCPAGSNIGVPVGIGHVFIQMMPMGGPENGQTRSFGFYPKRTTPYGDGIVKDDGTHGKDFCISYNVTAAQYNAAVGVINNRINTPGTYNVLTNNCVDFASAVASAAGITLPNTVNGANVSDPASAWISLDNIGNGGMNGGGTVTTAANVQDPNTPKDYSYVGITNDGHSNPGNLANYTGTTLVSTNLGNVNANSSTGMSFSLTNADLSNSIVSIDWGDGSPFENQQSSFTHVYSPGTYNGDLFVFDAGSVQSFDFMVNVSPSPGAQSVQTLATFPPSTVDNPGFDPATPAALVPEPAGLVLIAIALSVVGRTPRATGRSPMRPAG